MFAGIQCFQANLGMCRRNGQVDHDLNVGILQQLVNRAGSGDVVLFGLLPRPVHIEVGTGHKIKRLELCAIFHVNAADFAAADNPYLDFVHYWLSPMPV
ncbi:hypothetical protein D3C81_2000460 [compost metagenome]